MTTIMDLSSVVLDVASSAAAGLILVGGLAVLWGIKRVLGLFGSTVYTKYKLNNLEMEKEVGPYVNNPYSSVCDYDPLPRLYDYDEW